MSRVKRGTIHAKRVRNVLKSTKGFMWGRKSKIKLAKTARLKAGAHAYADRRKKKGEFRKLWNINLNAAVREHGLSYSRFIDKLKKRNITLNRKSLFTLAEQFPTVFAKLIQEIQK